MRRLGIGPPPVVAIDPKDCRCGDDNSPAELTPRRLHHSGETVLDHAATFEQLARGL